MHIPNDIKEMIDKYIKRYNKKPLPFNYDEWNSFDEYKEYLEKELKE